MTTPTSTGTARRSEHGSSPDETAPLAPDLGIIGGMGPAATTTFLRQLDALVLAERDQDHLAYVVWGDPRVPDRSEALLGRGPTPLWHLQTAVSGLNALGVRLIAIPCNTAHHWIDELAAISDVPIVDMVAETARRTSALHPGARVCILATLGTASSPLYRDRLTSHGLAHVTLGPAAQQVVEQAIRAVKANDVVAARDRLTHATELIERHRVDVAVVACTDLSFLLAESRIELGLPTIDASESLARTCLGHFGLPITTGDAEPRTPAIS